MLERLKRWKRWWKDAEAQDALGKRALALVLRCDHGVCPRCGFDRDKVPAHDLGGCEWADIVAEVEQRWGDQ